METSRTNITTSAIGPQRGKAYLSVLSILAFWTTFSPLTFAIQIISEGYLTPETISRAPAGFGSYEGYYFIPDFARGSLDPSLRKIWAMPPGGGPPIVFATNPNNLMVGGLFLPDTGWGVNSGRFLTTGRTTPASGPFVNDIYTYDSAGGAHLFTSISNAYVGQPRIAPSGFGSFAGQVLLPDSGPSASAPFRLLALGPDGGISQVATNLSAAFGLAFAPIGFGTVAGQALVSAGSGGAIISVKADGSSAPFANVILASGQIGLRQMEFSPSGFIPGYGQLLFVSISGSSSGGGTLGDVVAINSDGNVVKRLKSDLGLTKFDPRGLLFTDDGDLLISDSSDPIYLATAQDFTPPTPSTLANISTRLRVETGDNVLIGGFIVGGTQPKKVILRAVGPSLTGAGVPGPLANPTLELRGASGLIASNDNWRDAPNRQEIIDSTLAPTNDLEAAILVTLPANNSAYTAIVRGLNNSTGVGLVEAYDLNTAADAKLANISARGFVQTGDNAMIGGFIVVGQSATKVILRAIGPSLSISGKLANPTLELRNGNGTLLRLDDNWRTGGQEAEIIQTGIPPSHDLESAIISTLTPGNYTAIMRGVGNGTGIGLIETYDLGPP